MSARIYLAGLSGAGKSAVARRIGAWLGWPVLDVDAEVERTAGETIAELWRREGEEAFRRAEADAVKRLVEREGPAVLALGGGTLEDPVSLERLARWGTGVWLEAPPAELAERLAAEAGRAVRPLLSGGEPPAAALERLAAERGPRYRALPESVATAGRSVEAVAVDVLRTVTWPAPEEIADGVWLGRDALASAGEILAEAIGVAAGTPAGEVVVATDATVWDLHGEALAEGLSGAGLGAAPHRLPAGEAAKGVAGLEGLWDALAAAGADRDGLLAVLGGGAPGDVGGFAAATYKRGIGLTLFPTTLLAQVDAAIGGKNAIDLAGVKNLVGTFHFPDAVIADSLCLLTLPEREWRAGWAEVVKSGLIGDPELFALCEARAAGISERRLHVVEEAVARAATVKTRVVAADPREGGRRRVLNLGHTLGHAVEALAGGELLHGEAVAIGLVAAARLAESDGVAERGLADRVEDALERLGLPTRVPAGMEADDLIGRIGHDKKRAGGVVHMVLPVAPGEVEVRPAGGATVERWVASTVEAARAEADRSPAEAR